MFAALLLFAFTTVLAQPPKLSNDFTAEVKIDLVLPHRPERHLDGQWFSDITSGKRERFNADIPGTGRVDEWRFWNSTTGGKEVTQQGNSCHARQFLEPLFGIFDLLEKTHRSHVCDKDNYLWEVTLGHEEYQACISPDGVTPRWVEYSNLLNKHHVVVRFHRFEAGRPAEHQFVTCTPQ